LFWKITTNFTAQFQKVSSVHGPTLLCSNDIFARINHVVPKSSECDLELIFTVAHHEGQGDTQPVYVLIKHCWHAPYADMPARHGFHSGKNRSGADVLMSQAFRSLCLVCPPYREALSKTRQKIEEFQKIESYGEKIYKTFWDIGLRACLEHRNIKQRN
jgi:hypothetical protein